MQKQKRTSRQNFREAGLYHTWSTNGAQGHILDKLGYGLVRRLKDDRGKELIRFYFVKRKKTTDNMVLANHSLCSVTIGSIRQQKEGYSYALYNAILVEKKASYDGSTMIT